MIDLDKAAVDASAGAAGADTIDDELDGVDTSVASEASDATAVDKPAAKPARRRITADAPAKPKRQLTISVSGLVTGLVIAALVAALAVFVVRDVSARDDLAALRADVAARTHAEEVAGKYAVTAATLDYRDLTPWIANMRKGVSDDLRKQYDVIGQAMEQVLTPLRMQTTADLVVAKTVAVNGDIYKVQAVVNVTTKTIQTPNGGSTTAVYGLTLDKANNWTITSVGDPTSAIGNLGGTNGSANNGANNNGANNGGGQSDTPAPTTPAAGG